jgi:hypothetical protein
MKSIRLFFVLIFCSYISNAQELNRVEILAGSNHLETFSIPLGEKGVVVLHHTSKSEFIIRGYNTDLEQVWIHQESLDANLDYVTNCYDGKYLNLLFSRFKSNNYYIVRVNPKDGIVEKFQIFSVEKMEISNFKALNQSLFIGGIVNNNPVILYTNLGEKITRILPVVVNGEAEIQSMDLDTAQQQINVVYSVGKKAKNYQLILKSFDEDGNQLGQITMNPQVEYAQMNAKSTQLNDSLQVVVGTYGHKNTIGSGKGPSSQGVYFSSYLDGELQEEKFHSFTQFNNFFNFLGEKQKNKQEKKIKTKEEKGEELRLDYRLLMHEIIKKGDHYIVVAEAFYPDYKYANYSPWGGAGALLGGGLLSPWNMLYNPYRWGYGNYGLYSPFSSYYSPWGYRGFNSYSNTQQFDGWIYTHAVIAELDEKGNLLWDHSIDLNNIKEDKLIQKIKTSLHGDILTLSYQRGNSIISKYISAQGQGGDEKVQELTTQNEGDIIRRQEKSNLDFWFGNNFLASGNQSINNSEEGRRSVYFLTKIPLNP